MVLRRLWSGALVIAGALTLVFLVLFWLPGDPAEMAAGEDASLATLAAVRAQLGTDRPLWRQYTDYWKGLVHGDLGRSFVTREPVVDRLLQQLPATFSLAAGATLVALIAGLGLGIASAVYQGRPLDVAIQGVTLLLVSMPSFAMGIVLILVFSVALRWLPSIGNGTVGQLVLPSLCLGLFLAGSLARMVRSGILEVRGEPFVLTLRAKGLPRRQILLRHILRNALIPAVTLLGVLFGELLASVAVAETLFARQGLGRLVIEAVNAKDVPVVQGAILFTSVLYVLINLLVDLSYALLDPRVRG
jgi:ABC-type dipeptide/oligopeptide/nickel transport system permease component